MDAATVINFETREKLNVIIGGKNVKLKKDGTPKQSGGDRKSGKSSTVEPIRNQEDIRKARHYFKEQFKLAQKTDDKIRWARNYAIFVVGTNTALRIVDILKLRWGDILDENNEFYNKFTPQEQKTKKFNTKFVKGDMIEALSLYIDTIIESGEQIKKYACIFNTKRSGTEAMKPATVTSALKNMVEACNIKIAIGTHSMRKTYSYHYLMNNRGDSRALTNLQARLRHATPSQTLDYAGITEDEFEAMDEEMSKFYQDVDKGIFVSNDYMKIPREQLIQLLEAAYEIGKEEHGVDIRTDKDNVEALLAIAMEQAI